MTTSLLDKTTIDEWVKEKLDLQKVRENLQALGYDDAAIDMNLKAFKREQMAKRQFWGFVHMAIGAFLGFLSCVLTLTNPIPELYNWFLFGLTSIAILVICLGLYKVFE